MAILAVQNEEFAHQKVAFAALPVPKHARNTGNGE